jgi:hypothetical protein
MRLIAALAAVVLLTPALTWAEAGGVDANVHANANGGGAGVREGGGSSTTVGVSATVLSPNDTGTSAGGLERQVGRGTYCSPSNGPSIGKQASHYFLSRWYDLIDIVDFSIGAGPGFLFNVRATKIAQVGGGYSDAYRIGFRGRSAGYWREKRTEIGVSLLYYQKIKRERCSGWVESFRSDKMDLDTSAVYANNNDRAFLGIGATVHALVLVDVNVRPMQAVDFALGWFTIDILDDDTGHPQRNKDL